MINKKIIEKITPALQTLKLQDLILNTTEDLPCGKYKIAEGTFLVLQQKHHVTVKICGVRRNFIVVDLDDTPFHIPGYDKEQWKQKVLILRSSGEHLKPIGVFYKDGYPYETHYFNEFFKG